MALDLLDEHEQSELVRAWLRDNLGWIVLGLAVGAGAIGGWWKYQQVKKTHTDEAQIEYLSLADAAEKKDAAAITATTDKLVKDYEDSAYAAFAEMIRAQEAIKAGDAAQATKSLEWVRGHSKVPQIVTIASLRLAELKLAANDAAGALAIVDGIKEKDVGFKGQIADARGDALAALSRGTEARAAYEEALGSFDANSPQRQFVEWKRDAIADQATAAVTPPAPAATPAAPAAAPAAPAQPASDADAAPAKGNS